MKRVLQILIFLCAIFNTLSAQMKEPEPTVFIFVDDTMYAMKVSTSQTEIKRGWDIQGISVGNKTKRYFWGTHARQVTGVQPTFAIYPKEQSLNDYVILRLKSKREARYLPNADITKCDYERIELRSFRIESLPDFGFTVTPATPLAEGEYILFDITQEPVNEYGDFKAYDFCVVVL